MIRNFVPTLLFTVLSFTVCTAAAFSDPYDALINHARSQIGVTVIYDGSYKRIPYPGGDIAIERGVCTDVLIRAYRNLNIDLQQLVHRDMKASFSLYPARRIWGQLKPDTNIDHRRVPNLQKFFERFGKKLAVAEPPRPGDILTWMLPGNLPHIGIVSDRKTADGRNYLVIHNIGEGVLEEEVTGRFPLTGRYRYMPSLSE